MFEKLRTSTFRAALISTVLWMLCDFRSAFLAGTSAILYDAATDPAVQLSWRIAVQIIKHRASPPVSHTQHKARGTMRGPMKTSLGGKLPTATPPASPTNPMGLASSTSNTFGGKKNVDEL